MGDGDRPVANVIYIVGDRRARDVTMSDKFGGMLAGFFYIVFGLVWISMTASMTFGPGPILSVVGLIVVIYGLYVIFRSFRSKEFRPKESRVPGFELPDEVVLERHDGESNGFCPYCGAPLEDRFQYCGVCGRKLR